MDPLLSFLILVLVIALIAYLAIWVLNYLGPPDPFRKIAVVLIVVIACIVLLARGLPLLGVSL